jgi:hypothetical protein
MASIAEIRQQYPQYSDLSDQQLADALHKKFYSDMPRADFDAKIGLAKAPKEGGAMDALKSVAKTGYDYANQLRTGMAEGFAGLLALPRTTFEGVAAANRYVGGKAENALGIEPGTIVDPMQKYGRMINPLSYMPGYETTEGAVKSIEKLPGVPAFAGPPQSLPQKAVRYTGEAAGAAPFAGPAIIFGSGLGSTAGEEIASRTGVVSPKTGKAIGGLTGGLAASVPGMVRSTPAEMIARRTDDMTPAEWNAAVQRQQQANAQGTPLLGPEAMDNPAMQRLASDVAASSGGGRQIDRFLQGRVPAARAATEGQLNAIGPAAIPEDAARRLQEAATRVIQDASRARSAASGPYYEAAAATPIPQPSVAFLTQTIDDLARNAPQQVAGQLNALRQRILDNPTVGAVSGEIKLLREATRPDAIGVPLADRMAASRATPLVQAAEREMEAVSPMYATGQATHRAMSPRVNALEQGDIGRLAAPRPEEIGRVGSKLAQQWEVVANPENARPATIRAVATELQGVQGGAEAFRDLARTHLQNAFDKAFKDIQAGQNRMAPVNFRNSIAGTEQSRQNLQAVLEEAARLNGQNPTGVYAGFRNLLDTFERMGRVPGIGSPTASRSEAFAEASRGGVVNTVGEIANLTKPLEFATRWWRDIVQRGNMAELADIFTRPDSVQVMREMAMVRPGTARANALASQLVLGARGLQEQQQQ